MPTPKEFCDRLRAAREQRQMSQSELAEKAGLQPSAVSHFESGRRAPSFQNLKALADALVVTTDFLIGGSVDTGISNEAATLLFRHAKKMSEEDLETLTNIAEVFAKKAKPKK